MAWATTLLVANIFLQLWDGLATYNGLSLGVPEGNLLVRSCMEFYGVGMTLIGAKSIACFLLYYLHHAAALALSQWGLVLTALSYAAFSFVPWVMVLVLV